ncbi:MAG: hypothetical protein IKW54_00210 [Bacteroidales bacterium]|nr:hypothetical protein [Bacteroidales bacterium]
MTFSSALLKLKDWKKDKTSSYNNIYYGKNYDIFSVENIQRDLLSLAKNDGECSPSEVPILLAFEYVVIKENAVCFSCKDRLLRFSKKEILYVENEYNDKFNDEIRDNYENISNKLKLHGFEFVYIPKVKEFLIKKDECDLLKYAIRFMHPINVKNIDKADGLRNELKSVATDRFIKWYFNKNNINKSFVPSVLVKLKKTMVVKVDSKTQYESYSDYMMIPIENSVLSTLGDFVDKYMYQLKSYKCNLILMSEAEEMINSHSFHKTLLNYLVYKSFSGEVSELHICYDERKKERIEFKGIEQLCHLSASEMAVYIVVLIMTYKYGGLCRCKDRILEPSLMGKIQHLYNDIVRYSEDKDIYTSINTVIPKINKKITEVQRLEDFNVYQIKNPHICKNHPLDELKYSLNLNFGIVKFKFEGNVVMSLDEWIKRYWDGI